MESNSRIRDLIVKYWKGELADTEQAEVLAWAQQSPDNLEWLKSFDDVEATAKAAVELKVGKKFTWEKIAIAIPELAVKRIYTWPRMVAAAALIIIVASGYFWFPSGDSDKKSDSQTITEKQVEILPANSQAVITLDDGKKVVLDKATGLVAQQGSTEIHAGKTAVVYKAEGRAAAVSYNTLETFKGRQQTIVLADGSRVTLDAISKLRYPTAFPGDTRVVSLTGQAYFEVAKNKAKPFIVETNIGAKIQVTGTRFNVNARPDEVTIKSTLLEGGIRVHSASPNIATLDLSPGQEVLVSTQTNMLTLIRKADTTSAIAWKTGVFHFNGLSIQSVMKELQRYYDFQVAISDGFDFKFNGDIPHDMTLQNVFKVLEATKKVRFKIAGRKVYVLP